MLEVVSAVLVIITGLTLVFVLVVFVVVWFRERNLPPEEKARRRKLRLGSDPDSKGARRFRYAYGFMVTAYVLSLLLVVFNSWQGAQERQAELTAPEQEQTPAEQSTKESIDTSDWQIYRNDGLGYSTKKGREFELKYPGYFNSNFIEGSTREYFEVSGERPERMRLQVHLQSIDGFEYVNQAGAFSFYYDASADTWRSSEEGVSQDFAPKHRVTESGLVYYSVATGDGATSIEKVFVPHPKEDIVIEITLLHNESYRDCLEPCPQEKPFSNDETLHQILSTFRFVE